MKNRYRLIRRGNRGGLFYCVDTLTRKRTSLNTSDLSEAQKLLDAKAQIDQQPALSRKLAETYYAAADPQMARRTWADVFAAASAGKKGSSGVRWKTAMKDKAFDALRHQLLIETNGEMLLKVIQAGSVSTNGFLRRVHSFCLDMRWLPAPLVPTRQWPPLRYQEKRGITLDEHQRIIEDVKNPERKAYYQLAWHLGASQTDLANLLAENVDRKNRVISFFRVKTRWRNVAPPIIHYGPQVEEILNGLPTTGPLFPKLQRMEQEHRGATFREMCQRLGIQGVTLHSYRYAWAERAKVAGYPERFAQMALGHNSKAVHRAYARQAQMKLPSLEEFERRAVEIADAPK